jgi:polygalacturonase
MPPRSSFLAATLAAGAATAVAAAAPLRGGATFNLLSYGGNGDGATDNTAAFAAAVAAVAAAGGGTLFVPASGAGVFSTRAFNLTSGMTLFIESGAKIEASLDYAAWPLIAPLRAYPGDGPRYSPLIGGYGVHDVVITGNSSSSGRPAEVDGSGVEWFIAYEAKLLKGQRPHAIEFAGSTGIEIGSVAVEDAAFWTIHFSECVDVHVHDVVITSTVGNGDGVDIGAQNVLLERVSISTSDDAIAIKSGDAPADSGLPSSSNITIRDSTLASGEACVAIGSEMTAGVENVLVQNVTCAAAGHALLYIKERQAGGGFVRNVVVADSFISGPLNRFLWVSQHFGEHGENVELGDTAAAAAAAAAATLPVLLNVSLRNVVVVAGGVVVEPALLNGARAPPGVAGAGAILGIALQDIVLGATLESWSCVNASGTWRNVTPAPCAALTPVAAAAA